MRTDKRSYLRAEQGEREGETEKKGGREGREEGRERVRKSCYLEFEEWEGLLTP